jgi:hypothetical protein
VIGLLHGLGEIFNKKLEITHTLKQEESGFDEFKVVYI